MKDKEGRWRVKRAQKREESKVVSVRGVLKNIPLLC